MLYYKPLFAASNTDSLVTLGYSNNLESFTISTDSDNILRFYDPFRMLVSSYWGFLLEKNMRCKKNNNPDSLKRDILIDAIVGKGFYGLEDAEHFTDLGYAKFTGNQHNYEWKWIRGRLKKLHTMDLERVYSRKVE